MSSANSTTPVTPVTSPMPVPRKVCFSNPRTGQPWSKDPIEELSKKVDALLGSINALHAKVDELCGGGKISTFYR